MKTFNIYYKTDFLMVSTTAKSVAGAIKEGYEKNKELIWSLGAMTAYKNN